MQLVREYQGWDADDSLDPEAESVLACLDDLCTGGILTGDDDVVARIDEYGMVTADVPVAQAALFLQAGDGWDRVIWTTPAGRPYEWRWDTANALREGPLPQLVGVVTQTVSNVLSGSRGCAT